MRSKFALYEELKRKIYLDSKSNEEYERRIKALARKLKI
jgi:hypothetical protein